MPTSDSTRTLRNHAPWNKGRLLGQKRPLRPKDVWTIRVRLQLEGRKRDLAMFNLAIDSKLRGCDLVRLQANDVCVGGRVRDRAVVIQKKTGRPVQFEVTETRRSVQDWLDRRGAMTAEYLFPSGFTTRTHISTRQYARIVQKWVASAGLDGSAYGTHSMRQSGSDIQEDGQFARCSTFVGAHQVGKHGPLSRHRGRRRSQHFRAGRSLNVTNAAA
jgi:integrase